jgi:hypothetical protein
MPAAPIANYYHQISILTDILTKREYFYRELLFSKKKIVNLPNYVLTNPKNTLIHDLKSVFLFTNPTTFNNEYSRDVYYNVLEYFNFSVFKPALLNLGTILGLPNYFINAFEQLFYKSRNFTSNNQRDLMRSQYRPMRKGINNMIRLHGTGAVAMPIEMRLQVLASSKDVIHS